MELAVYEGFGYNSWSWTYANNVIYEWLMEQKSGIEKLLHSFIQRYFLFMGLDIDSIELHFR
jgi:hypothetical protein|tara:strand:+ start:85 stop:270 length:186 start_codon:yes stop_codon:yes gene_type:complete